MNRSPREDDVPPVTSRLVGAAFGSFLIALAVFTVVTSTPATRVGSLVVAGVVGGLGLEAVVSAARNRRSLLSRIGPLP